MIVRETRRAEALDRIADHMLAHGLGPSSLRALGQTAGISDRMLLYYFADKDEIVLAALGTIATRLAAVLAALAPEGRRMGEADALRELAAICRSPDLRPFMRVWVELVSLAARGQQPFLAASGQIADYFIAWVAGRLDGEDATAHDVAATRMIAFIDGLVLLDFAGRAGAADRAVGGGGLEVLKN